ncbi:MAG: hypothetical protein KGJ64_05485 [Betaproteobacteria bacterium]|nr:hypothetical protein [Betaproteobacteria bacterium]
MLARWMPVVIAGLLGVSWSAAACGAAALDQWQINQQSAGSAASERRVMNQALDVRLRKLQARDPHQFAREMALQKEFNAATERLCSAYAEIDHGSSGDMCVSLCRQYLYDYRTRQARGIDRSELSGARASVSGRSYAAPYFHRFSSDFCSVMPPSVWKAGVAPRDCAQSIDSEIERSIAGLVYGPREQGNVCAGFGRPR